MEFNSPHREGVSFHLPSPKGHGCRVDGFLSIQNIRRSLSHSPSKPSRFSLYPQSPSGSPGTLSRSFSTKTFTEPHRSITQPTSPSQAQSPATTSKKSKFPLRRTAPTRLSARTRSAQSPVRYALGDATNSANLAPAASGGASTANSSEKPIPFGVRSAVEGKTTRFGLNDEPIRFDIQRSRTDHFPLGSKSQFDIPAKSSPLKRSDGIMNLDQATLGSPRAKRRSLHGPLFGSDFDVFDYAPVSTPESDNQDPESDARNNTGASPNVRRPSPLRKSLSLRKSTLQHRHGPAPRSKSPAVAPDRTGESAPSGSATPRARQRMSLDSSLSLSGAEPSTPFRKPLRELYHADSQHGPTQHRPAPDHQPHPLSHALSPASSSGMVDDSPTHAPVHAPVHAVEAVRQSRPFTRSLPIGVTRKAVAHAAHNGNERTTSDESYATPEAYKMAKPLPAAFMSTGLISKRNRHVDAPSAGSLGYFAMPDTPSKRVSFPPATNTPFHKSSLSKSMRHLDDSGSGTPFSPSAGRSASSTKGMDIFGAPFRKPAAPRRESFASIDGDDWPGHGLHTDSQSSNDELPPTPTKATAGSSKSSHVKENSLRSSLLGRRSSLGPETFVPLSSQESDSPKAGKTTPISGSVTSERNSPRTPQESFLPPDPSGLSISGKQGRRASIPFGASTSSAAFPPATPTAQRDQPLHFGGGIPPVAPLVGLRPDDVDTALTSRFDTVTVYGNGEFSKVYRVEKPLSHSFAATSPRSVATVWAVKKNKRPYTGFRDRERKLREVEVLTRLRNHDNIIQLTDSWEAHNHLYIQTEFCENGNLRDFLTSAGYKARLDDFRIWKILFELTHGVKSIHDSGVIHLDLKPANVFIDWEGVLKIGDFGLASPWPAPSGIDGEGDREYIGPEVLSGCFDKPADIFALGMIMLEIAGNIVLPDNGLSWQRLRSGNFSDVPSLTWSSESTLARDEAGDPIVDVAAPRIHGSPCRSESMPETFKYHRDVPNQVRRSHELLSPPNFMVDAADADALDKLVQWMIAPNPSARPVIDQVFNCDSVQWVGKRRRAGATIYEGNWGPSDDVFSTVHDVEMLDAA